MWLFLRDTASRVRQPEPTTRGAEPTTLAEPCIIMEWIPILTDMARLPGIAADIARIQAGTGAGIPGDEKRALHRLRDQGQCDRNRANVCSTTITGTAPRGMSCDEDPFASTCEGGDPRWGPSPPA
ncbi:NucA/NucB deoxyribonuclease domain-containing protein [Nonomuraea muscovyensis]|uniref:NucA/NucB deoxyribonuclease domain-containing protein n=1 Tax=Nonomuraea muscovyensis TaxID=1124761 RepID=UPI003F4D172D